MDWCDGCGKPLGIREGNVLQGQPDLTLFCKKCTSKNIAGEK